MERDHEKKLQPATHAEEHARLPSITSYLYLPPRWVCPIASRVNNSWSNRKSLNDSYSQGSEISLLLSKDKVYLCIKKCESSQNAYAAGLVAVLRDTCKDHTVNTEALFSCWHGLIYVLWLLWMKRRHRAPHYPTITLCGTYTAVLYFTLSPCQLILNRDSKKHKPGLYFIEHLDPI